MNIKGKKVFVAMSGGVDSSTAAAVLLEQGCDCSAIYMITSEHTQPGQTCAREAARKLGIRLHVLDLRREFERILDYLCSEYSRGRTPNPCVVCNRRIKFGRLWEYARDKGADFLATGHYARVIETDDGPALYSGLDQGKEQSYALSMVNRDMLSHIIFPVGDHRKQQTRELAAKFGLAAHERAESQEICFIPDDDYAAVVESRRPELARRGRIVDNAGRVLGEHNGIHRFTVGQRRGLGVAMGEPYYVTRIDAATNTVTLGPKKEVMHNKLWAGGANWLTEKPQDAFRALVQIRYNSEACPAVVRPSEDVVEVEFEQRISAITPGQLAVFYRQDAWGNRVIGGAWIEKVGDT